jgi:hypothetical protein
LEDNAEKLGRAFGAPKREGSILLGLPIPDGEEGAGSPEGPGNREFRAGEAGRAFEVGDADCKVTAGDAGRASFDGPDTAGLPGRGIPPMRVLVAGELGLAMLDCRRVICETGADASYFS